MTAADAAVPHVAFVRAIMIGREGLHREVVLDLFRTAGADVPVSYIATGNVSFEAAPSDIGRIVGAIEAGIEAVTGRPKPLYVRTLEELQTMVADEPWAGSPFTDVDERDVIFFRDTAPAIELPIVSPSGSLSVFASSRRELFCVSRRIDGRAPEGSGGLIERLTGEQVTVRAWSTVTTIVRKLDR